MDERRQEGASPHTTPVPLVDQREAERLSRRVLVPIERRTSRGTIVFRTHDKMVYTRLDDGSIRRGTPKIRGKQARKADKLSRRKIK